MRIAFGIIHIVIDIGVCILFFWLLVYASLTEIALVIGAAAYVRLIVIPASLKYPVVAWVFRIMGFILFLGLWVASGFPVIAGGGVLGFLFFHRILEYLEYDGVADS